MTFKPAFLNLEQPNVVSEATRLKVNQFKPIPSLPVRVDGVLEGGGALGTAYTGALRALHDHNIWFARIAGNSAGAITAAMIAVGFTAPEIQWLSSAYAPAPKAPTSLTQVGITTPIAFESFLDLPQLSTVRNSRKKTLLWQYLKGQILEEVGKQSIPVMTRAEAVAACSAAIMAAPLIGAAIQAIPNVVQLLTRALNVGLGFLPTQRPNVKNYLPDTTQFREQFADTVWDAIARNSPLLMLTTNLLHEGSIFEGNVFLRTIKELFGKKIHKNPGATVLFKDLKIPLAVIAADIDTGHMIVYNSKDHPNMEVAVAVRQSMSIPFVFQPQGKDRQIVDGGLFSNFPAWLFTDGGNQYWPPNSLDAGRVKIGLSLNDTQAAPALWKVKPPRFQLTGTPPHVDKGAVLKPILAEKFAQLGVPQATTNAEFSLPDWEIMQEISGFVSRGALNTESATRKPLLAGLMAGKKYIDVEIPLLGYDGFDFGINEDEGALFALWDRAWHAAIDALANAKAANVLPASFPLAGSNSPYD